MWKRKGVVVQCYLILLTICFCVSVHAEGVRASGPLVKKEERWPVISNEYGEISAVRISDAINGSYLLHFFTLEPNSLLLPLLLNAHMLFYVHAGSGRVSWTEEDELKHMNINRGDVYRLVQGSVLYMRSEDEGLKIHAIFANSNDDLREPATQPYSSIQDLVLGFDKTILQATFKVSELVIDELLGGTKPPLITQVDNICGGDLDCNVFELNKKKKKDKKEEKEKEKEKEKEHARLFNIFEEKKDVENCNGWSTRVTNKQLAALEGSNIGLVMVNLNAGSMMEPHWNTMDTEVLVVLEGRGMVRVSSPSISKERGGREMRLEVEQGDVFIVPRFHPTVQMAFNNGSFVFMGFTRMTKTNNAHFIAGETSVLQLLSKEVLQVSFNVKRTTLDELLAPREDSVISSCISCAEEEMQIMEEGGGDKGEEEAGTHHGGGHEEEAGRQREREEGRRRHGGDEEEAGWRHHRGGEEEEKEEEEEETEWQRERGEARRHHGGDEEETGRRHHWGEEEEEEEEEEESEWRRGGEQLRQNHHHYVQGVRRILKSN